MTGALSGRLVDTSAHLRRFNARRNSVLVLAWQNIGEDTMLVHWLAQLFGCASYDSVPPAIEADAYGWQTRVSTGVREALLMSPLASAASHLRFFHGTPKSTDKLLVMRPRFVSSEGLKIPLWVHDVFKPVPFSGAVPVVPPYAARTANLARWLWQGARYASKYSDWR